MKEFVLKHPYLTTFFILPTLVGGVVGLVQAARGKMTPFEEAVAKAAAQRENDPRTNPEAAQKQALEAAKAPDAQPKVAGHSRRLVRLA